MATYSNGIKRVNRNFYDTLKQRKYAWNVLGFRTACKKAENSSQDLISVVKKSNLDICKLAN